MNKRRLPSKERLATCLDYDEETGQLHWRISKGRAKAGSVAGSLNKNGYYYTQIDGSRFESHRIIWALSYDKTPDVIDHINKITTDNRLCNLRNCTNSENMRNSYTPKDNKSGFPGVSWHKPSKRWQAQIQCDNKYIPLGYFTDFDAAVLARKKAQQTYGFSMAHGTENPKYA